MKKLSFFFALSACTSSGSLRAVGTTSPRALAPSQVGTVADGALRADAHGHFLADAGARRAFDWVLTASGETDDATLQAQLEATIDAELQAPANAEAHAFLQSYLAYRSATLDSSSVKKASTLGERLAALSQLRQRFFDTATHQALFGDEEQHAQISAAQQAVHDNPSLSPADKAAAVATLDAQLPAAFVAARASALTPLQSFHAEAALRATGDGVDAVHAQRVQTFGAEGAARLAALDAAHAVFSVSMANLRALRDALKASPERDAQAALDQAIATQFPAAEQAHARALLAQ